MIREYNVDIKELRWNKKNEMGKAKVAEANATGGLGNSSSWDGYKKRVEIDQDRIIHRRVMKFQHDLVSSLLTSITHLFDRRP